MNGSRLCVSISAPTTDEVLRRARVAESEADILEIRFDGLASPDEAGACRTAVAGAGLAKPLIATFRPADQGGADLNREQRVAFWRGPAEGFWAADVEEDAFEAAADWPRRIVSFHDLRGGSAVEPIFDRLAATGADMVKLAVTVNDAADAIPLWRLLERAKAAARPFIPIAMGEAGRWTRILGPGHGAYITYAADDGGRATAPGQFTIREMLDIYRVAAIGPRTAAYGVIGDPVSASLSPRMHNAAFAATGLDAVFMPFTVRDIDAFMTRMVNASSREAGLEFGGFAVTMPHKLAVMPHLDEVADDAAAIGAVNTISIKGGRATGHNTDAAGFIAPLKRRFDSLRDVRVLVVGAGGAARACVYALKREGARITVTARNPTKTAAFAEEFNIAAAEWPPRETLDIVVNATPVGMLGQPGDRPLFPAAALRGVRLVYDLVTAPGGTPLMREAERAGVPVIGGVEMLIEQAAEQFRVWTGREAPVGAMKTALENES